MSKMSFDVDSKQRSDFDEIRIKNGSIGATLNILTGKQGDYFLHYCPSLEISGYGRTVDEAVELIKSELEIFCEDLFEMNQKEREQYLISLGFKKEKFHNKNFSKAYVDENGRLKDFDKGTVKRELLQTA
ncbi:MAG TPA: hypothetical protein VKX40_16570 [Aequorivita sp.]|nr:hypothetical protein [Aequorivita sp.]